MDLETHRPRADVFLLTTVRQSNISHSYLGFSRHTQISCPETPEGLRLAHGNWAPVAGGTGAVPLPLPLSTWSEHWALSGGGPTKRQPSKSQCLRGPWGRLASSSVAQPQLPQKKGRWEGVSSSLKHKSSTNGPGKWQGHAPFHVCQDHAMYEVNIFLWIFPKFTQNNFEAAEYLR